jgi:hypothetical protein
VQLHLIFCHQGAADMKQAHLPHFQGSLRSHTPSVKAQPSKQKFPDACCDWINYYAFCQVSASLLGVLYLALRCFSLNRSDFFIAMML